MTEKLFAEFPPVSTEQWEEVIVKDLKGADYEKKLVWKTQEGFSVRPYYRAEDLKGLKFLGTLPGEFPYVRGTKTDNNWLVLQTVCCCEGLEVANKKALDILNKGVESIGFFIDGSKVMTQADFEVLLNGICLAAVPVNFLGCCLSTAETLDNFLAYINAQGYQPDAVRASFDFDPINALTQSGNFCKEGSFAALKACIEKTAAYQNITVISVNAATFNAAGSTLSQELGFALAAGSEYMAQLTELGVSARAIAKNIKFSFAIGSSYFMEIAKFRAARMLWANIVDTFGAEGQCAKKMFIRATTSEWNQTVYDAYVNMLRGTTEAMSAALAGVDEMEVLPYDFAFRAPTEFSARIARNVQILLKEESHFDKVVDPAAGSYFIENLTDSMATAAWNLFQKVEEAGGYIEAFKAGFIQNEVKAVAEKRAKNIATRREILLGTNQYPNFLEKAEDCITKDIVNQNVQTCCGQVCECTCENRIAEPLRTYRGAQEFEALRFATDISGVEPKAFMLTFGNLAMCRARSQFASNFFAVAGIRIMDNNRFATIEEGVKAALESQAQIVVACSSDDEYAEAVPQIAELLGDKAILVVAGDPACREDLEAKGITNFINVKSNVLETLKEYQAKLGIQAI
ncbi:MAG: methylmalonyl-CoA mutase small subunit [Bacteroidales bacterium]|nr:methylmalonyl-CoA mutase small subunit [Bacteroidales bacterium]